MGSPKIKNPHWCTELQSYTELLKYFILVSDRLRGKKEALNDYFFASKIDIEADKKIDNKLPNTCLSINKTTQ